MSDVTVKRIEELDYFKGPKAIPGIKFRSAGRELGVSAWGMNVLELDPNFIGYPEHDHQSDGQEEVYVVLRGGGTMKAGGQEQKVEPGTLVRVGPQAKRHFTAGPEGLTMLAIGATPGKAYAPRR